RQKLISIGDDYWIEDADGHRAFHVDGKVMRLRQTFVLEDAGRREIAKIQERKLGLRDRMRIERQDGPDATVKKALVGFRDRFIVDIDGGDELRANGNLVDHEYEISRDGNTVATISKRWFAVRDTYGVDIKAGEDEALVLAITVCIDAMAHDE
ncbi:MAG TPA: LURP-one-related family protein, partial [Micromonosporaceae bacterium]